MFRRIRNNIMLVTFRQVRDILSAKEKKKFVFQVLYTIGGGCLEVAGVALLVPLILVAQKPEVIHTNHLLSSIYVNLGFNSDSGFLLFLVFSVLFAFILKNAVSLYIIHRQTKYAFDISLYISERQYWKNLDRGYLYLKDKGSVEINYFIFNVPGFFAWGIVLPFVTILSELMVLVLIVISIGVYNPALLLSLFFALLPAAIITYNSTKNRLYDLGKQKETAYKDSFGTLNRAVLGYTDLKLTGKESIFLKRYLKGYSKMNKNQQVQAFLSYLPSRFLEVFAVLGIVIIFAYTILFTNDTGKLLEFVGVFAAAAFRIMPSMNRILMALMSMKNHQYTFNSLKDDGAKPENGRAAVKPVLFQESLEFKDVSFRYSGSTHDAVSGINLNAKMGDKIGIIGESGSGKTTLMNLLLRFIVEDSGDLLIDGKKITEEDTKGLRRWMGYVQQDVFLMDDSLRRNIAFGEEDNEVNEEQVLKAIEQASLKKFVATLPDGLDTRIGEMGAKLSGGQKQRIGIARALYRNSRILVFDEATSALDNETEKEVTEAIDHIGGEQRIIFIIAHRITTLRSCNRIIEMKDGTISGIFTYDQLIRERIN